jgi:3-hydroxymyristoyl/3-hydroxydecanoyl-(acyl carrier protein) dehydratase
MTASSRPLFFESQPQDPEVVDIERTSDRAQLKLLIPKALLFFSGHFPQFALLPGVVQVHWTIQYAMQEFPLGAVFPTMIRIKFRKPIRPNHAVTLILKHVPARNTIHFEYVDADGPCSSGQIGFAPE